VPDALRSKIVAGIPAAKAAVSLATSITSRWPWIAGLAGMFVMVSVAFYAWQMHGSSKPPVGANEDGNPTVSSPAMKNASATSKAIQKYEQAVLVDPYDAYAWFGLAKAQAEVNRSEDAISSARKSIDIARSRNRSDLVSVVETWLRSYEGPKPSRPHR
jgi:tetratricopeptide (TPR) repeat protein